MKKNLVTVITLALVLINLVLTAFLLFVLLPETRQVNEFVTKVAAAVDLDVSGGKGAGGGVSLDNTEPYTYSDQMTINLADSGDGKEHFAAITPVLMINKNSTNYKTYGGTENFKNYEGAAADIIQSVIRKHTYEDMKNNTDKVQDEIVEQLKTVFGDDLIVQVVFSKATYQ